MTFLRVDNISLQEKENVVLESISFAQQQFQKVAIAGETGAGKSTLLQVITGLVQPTAGEVWFEDRKVKGPHDVLVPGHAGIAYLSQQFELPQFLRVEQVLRYASKRPAAEAEALYALCRISHLLARPTDQLSGGERQRIALARLLLSSPRLLLLDEPYSNLDMRHKTLLKTVIRDVSEQLGITCILISHDPLDTLSWADELLVMQKGRLIQRGTPVHVYRQPVNAYVAGLFGGYNLLTGAALKAFAKLTGVKPTGETMLIRPENFKLTTASHGLLGQVTSVRFFGSYSEIEVGLLKSRLTVKTTERGLVPGAQISLTLATEDVWYV